MRAPQVETPPETEMEPSTEQGHIEGCERRGCVCEQPPPAEPVRDPLRECEEELGAVFRTSPSPIVVSELDTSVIVDVNDRWCEITGYTREEVIGRPSLALGIWFDPEDRRRLDDELRRFGKVHDVSLRFFNKHGGIRQVKWSGELIRRGGRSLIVSQTLDLTDTLAIERALAEREVSFRLLVQYSHDLIGVLDDTGRIVTVTGQVTRMLGYLPEQLIGKVIFGFVDDENRSQVIDMFQKMLEEPRGLRHAIFRFAHADGSWVPIEGFAVNQLGDQMVRGIVFNMRDISERLAAEQAQRKLQAQLEQAMKMEAVGRLAGGIAHDFNNLLTSVLGNAELAALQLGQDNPIGVHLSEISQAARSATSLTRKLLTFSRQQVLEVADVDANGLIRELEKLLHRTIGEDIELETSLEADVGYVRMDPNQLEQVILNLAVNARDAMPEGGRLSISTERVLLDASFCEAHPKTSPGSYVRLTVADTGRGIPSDVKPHIFEPFFTTKAKGHGTGLGLSIVFGIVDQAKGAIDVQSDVGEGTSFRLYFPRVEAGRTSLAQAEESLLPLRGTERILLVEDDALVRALSVELLGHLGYEVVSCASGAEALTLLRRLDAGVDLLMTDVVMPGMNGRELVRQALALYPHLKILYASGYADSVILHQGDLEKGIAFINKPFSLRQLSGKVRQVLDTAKSKPSAAGSSPR